MLSAPTVLIRTLPLTSGNYGGILQAYALQKVVDDLGFTAFVDSPSLLPNVERRYVRELARVLVLALRVPKLATPERRARALDQIVSPARAVKTLDFVARNIRTVDRSAASPTLHSFDAYVVGSDQVWRSAYADLQNFFFADLPRNRLQDCFSYAASFGLDELHGYSRDDILLARSALRAFSAVSVREAAGAEICRVSFDVAASVHVDPTMLVPRETWAGVSDDAPVGTGYRIVTYVLDHSAESLDLISKLSAQLPGHNFLELRSAHRSLFRPMVSRPSIGGPSVERWLGAIRQCDYLITDSFHGCVFSILFNRSFACVLNRGRGASRLYNLLETFGLEDRLVKPGAPVDPSLLTRPIDWLPINREVERRRMEGIDFLRAQLSCKETQES